jgi:hypothetical protein
MMLRNSRQPIIMADTGPMIRLAAAGLLDTLRLLNRRVVIVDRVEEEAIADLTKPFAPEIKAWIESMGDAIHHANTVEGRGIASLRDSPKSPQLAALLKKAMRNSGERALREFVELHAPQSMDEAIVLYEDIDTHNLLSAAMVPLTAVTTRRFAQLLSEWGINADAVGMLESITPNFDLRPANTLLVTPQGYSAK